MNDWISLLYKLWCSDWKPSPTEFSYLLVAEQQSSAKCSRINKHLSWGSLPIKARPWGLILERPDGVEGSIIHVLILKPGEPDWSFHLAPGLVINWELRDFESYFWRRYGKYTELYQCS